jgi:hypothetical protein
MPTPSRPIAHKVTGVRAALEAYGAELLFLPPYSPGLDPSSARRRMIRPPKERRSVDRRGEQPFAKLKAMLRQAAERSVRIVGPSAGPSIDSHLPNAAMTSPMPDMDGQRENALAHRYRVRGALRERSHRSPFAQRTVTVIFFDTTGGSCGMWA